MMQYFGTVSGRDEDKIAKYALTKKEHGAYIYFEEARLTMLTKKLYAQKLDPSCFTNAAVNGQEDFPQTYYPEHDYHTMYIAEIESILLKE